MSLRQESRGAQRKKGFKKGVDLDDARRKRGDDIVALRKSTRDENLQKKRAVFASTGALSAMEDSTRGGPAAVQQKVGQTTSLVIFRAARDACQSTDELASL